MFINFIAVTIVTYLHSFHLQFCTLAETMIKIFKRIHRLLIHRHPYSRYNIRFVLVIKAWVFFFIADLQGASLLEVPSFPYLNLLSNMAVQKDSMFTFCSH